MKNRTIILVTLIIAGSLHARDWVEVNSPSPAEPSVSAISSGQESVKIFFELSGYFIDKTDDGNKITFPGGISILEKGSPDIPIITRSIQIPDLAKMELKVLDSDFIDVPLDNLISSKGNLTRDIKIQDVPYEKGDAYENDSFFPKVISYLRDPHIIRTKRGQAIVIQPFQYNPIQGVLRVYTNIILEASPDGISSVNPLVRYPDKNSGVREMEEIYKQHFINYSSTTDRYAPVDEDGTMLIICYGPFIESMQPFIEWKTKRGMQTELVDVADIGDADAIKTYVEEYYYTYGLNFLLLVGDIDQIPSTRFSEGAGSNSPSDTYYGFIPTGDYYPDVFVGRFSAENTEHVSTMVNRTIAYERYPDAEGIWYKEGAGFASDQGPGDDGEMDNEHMDIIREKLLNYTYTEIDQVYDPSGTVADGEVAINEGLSVINYTGHGSNGSWVNGCPMNNTNVNSLTNSGMFPWIWSVACVNGEFHIGTCFAETWLRATDADGSPTGAVATLMSTVNQAWNPPMDGQDEMNSIFVESYSNNIKRTFGGLSYNGCMEMNDNYGSSGDVETLYWTTFGDPSFVVRSDTPQQLTVVHDNIMIIGSTQFSVQTNSNESVIALSRDGVLLGVSTADGNGICQIILDEPVNIPGTLDLVVTSYNHMPYETEINVIAPDGSYMLLDGFSLSSGYEETITFWESVELTTSIENVGTESSGEIVATLIPQTDNVYMTSPIIEIDPVNSGDVVTVGPFGFDVSINSPNQDEVVFHLHIQDDEQSWEYPINLNVNAPAYQLASSFIFDGGNGSLDPGESATIQLVLENSGSAALNYPTFTAYENDPYLTLGEVVSDNAYYWEPGISVVLTIEVSVSDEAPLGHSSIAWLNIGSLNTDYEFLFPLPLTVGMLMENFETANFSGHDWQMAGQSDWFIQEDEVHSGDYAARSGNIGNNQSSELSVEYNVLHQGSISFSAKASSEQGNSGTIYDYLTFYIDNEQMLLIGGESDWDEYSFVVTPGEHIFRWVYEKDAAGSSGDDCAWIDNIIFPPGSIPPLNINFGDLNQDGNINVLDIVLTVSSVLGYGTLNGDQILAADINMDGQVNVLDITLIIDMLFAD